MKRNDEDLKQIAVDMFEGKIYSDRHAKDAIDFRASFIPIGLGAFSKYTDEEIADIGLIFEYLDNATYTLINGNPVFMSFQTLCQKETIKMFEYYESYKMIKNEFLLKECVKQ